MRKHPLADCELCPLEHTGYYSPSSGPTTGAALAVVGEAPTANDAKYGGSFTGASGKLLDIVLHQAGFERKDVFISNACLCRPSGNETPPTAAIAACRGRLLMELRDSSAETVVALGNTAAQSILGTRMGITSLRIGPSRTAAGLPGVRVIPTIHPAAALRNADAFPHILTDFNKIGLTNGTNWRPPEWRSFDDPGEARTVLEQLLAEYSRRPVAVDIEVGVEKDTAFDHPNEYDLLCVGFSYAKGRAIVIGEHACKDTGVRDLIRRVLSSVRIIAQNGKFDLAGLYNIHRGDARLWFDTMLAHYCLDERPGQHGLKAMAVELLGAPQYDYEIKQYVGAGQTYANIPRPLLYQYNAYDCAVTFELYEMFSARLDRKNLRGVHDFLVAASNELMYLELNGITVDVDKLNELIVSYQQVLETIVDRIQELAGDYRSKAGGRLNPSSPIQLKEFFLSQGIRLETTGVETLKLLQEKIAPQSQLGVFLDELLDHRKESKLYGTYIKGTAKRLYRGRIHSTFLLHGTTSGRLASRNPNLQNVPRGSAIRQLYVPSKPDNVFVQRDYSQAELRVVACLAQDEYLRSIFIEPDRSIHKEFASRLYGANYTKEQYIRTKAYIFGMAYGREAYSIAMEYKIPVPEAKSGITMFFDQIPATVKWREDTRQSVLDGNDLVTPFGRHRRFWLITDENRKDVMNEALAFLPQSTASDICLSAAVELRPKLRGLAYMRLLVHDSILVECNKKDAEEVSEIMGECMSRKGADVFGDYVPFFTDASIGRSWGEL